MNTKSLNHASDNKNKTDYDRLNQTEQQQRSENTTNAACNTTLEKIQSASLERNGD